MTATLQCPCPSRYSMQDAERDQQPVNRLLRKRRSRRGLNAIEDATLAHLNARYMAFVAGPDMQSRARVAELKEIERRFGVAFGPPLTYREQALLYCLSTLYPPKKAYCNPEFSAEQSAFSAEEFDDDDSLEYQRTRRPRAARPGAPGGSAPSEAIDTEEEANNQAATTNTCSSRAAHTRRSHYASHETSSNGWSGKISISADKYCLIQIVSAVPISRARGIFDEKSAASQWRMRFGRYVIHSAPCPASTNRLATRGGQTTCLHPDKY